jgi:hypothetical protein
MFVYNLHYETDLSILLYPKTTVDSAAKKPFRNEKFKGQNCQVAFSTLFNENDKLDRHLGIRLYNELIKDEINVT